MTPTNPVPQEQGVDPVRAVKLAAAMWDGRAPGTPTLTHEQLMTMAVAALRAANLLSPEGLTREEMEAQQVTEGTRRAWGPDHPSYDEMGQ